MARIYGSPMSKPRALVLTLILCASAPMIAGCGQLAYKTGAGADALEADEQACKQGSVDQNVYAQCMHEKGWSIANLDGSSTAPVAPVAPSPSPSGAPVSPDQPAGSATVAPAAPLADPMAPVKVTTWIRFGGGGPSDDIVACVATLGPANQPDTVNKTVTRALLACMREKGWRGL
jgi:hypothetical protein